MSAPRSNPRHYDTYISSTALLFCAHRQGTSCNCTGLDKDTILGRKAVFSSEAWRRKCLVSGIKTDNNHIQKKRTEFRRIVTHLCAGDLKGDDYWLGVVTGGDTENPAIHLFSLYLGPGRGMFTKAAQNHSPHPPPHPWRSQRVPKPDRICNPSSALWVCPRSPPCLVCWAIFPPESIQEAANHLPEPPQLQCLHSELLSCFPEGESTRPA